MKIKDKESNTILNVTSEDVIKQMLKDKRYEEVKSDYMILKPTQKEVVRSKE